MTGLDDTVKAIGRYEVIRKIATGGMAELFLGRFLGPGGFEKRCAIKRVLPQFAADQAFTRMFLNEAKVTAMFDHPNLVQIFELGQDDRGQFYIAMELVNGMNLRQLLHLGIEKKRSIPPELAAHMMSQALDGLAYAHAFRDQDGKPFNLVHRDISPQNILVSYDGAVKVVDFGIVKGSSISGETQSGMLKGKVAYMSPEQACGDALDARSDLFSLGICFFELITGERPFQAPNEIMTLKAILEHTPTAITQYAPDCAEEIERIVYRSLEKNPEHRYANARAFHEDIERVLRGCPTPLGRHVVSEFMQSLTEGSTDAFDSTKLRIPRRSRGAGFAHSLSTGTGSGEVALPASSYAPLDSAWTPPEGSKSDVRAIPMDGIEAEMRAAGVGSSLKPILLGSTMVVLSALVLGGLWLNRTHDAPVLVKAATVPEEAKPAAPIGEPEPRAEPERPPPAERAAPPPERAAPPPEPRATPSPTRERAHRKKERGPKGTLAVTSVPRGLSVVHEGRILGQTPLEVDVAPGRYSLKLVNERLGISRRLETEVQADSATRENLVVGRGTVKVVSRPWADVYVNGVHKGKTPVQFPMYEGQHELRLVNPEAGERTQSVKVDPNKEILVPVKF